MFPRTRDRLRHARLLLVERVRRARARRAPGPWPRASPLRRMEPPRTVIHSPSDCSKTAPPDVDDRTPPRRTPAVRGSDTSARRRRDVDDDSHADSKGFLGRDTVEIDMVDDGDVVRGRPPHEVLRAPVSGPAAAHCFAWRVLVLGSGSCSSRPVFRSRRRQPSKGTRGRRAYARSPSAARRRRAHGCAYASDRRVPSRR